MRLLKSILVEAKNVKWWLYFWIFILAILAVYTYNVGKSEFFVSIFSILFLFLVLGFISILSKAMKSDL